MKSQALILIMIAALATAAFCQVDTMRLLEVGSVTAPGPITNWYFEDLNGDSIKEIILTTANSVNIYSGQSFAPIWSQDGFTNPKDLNCLDLNNDGLRDISLQDNQHIYFIDPNDSSTIWVSSLLDSTYRFYAVGDWNADAVIDIAIGSYKGRDETASMDTIIVRLCNGNQYIPNDSTYILLNNYHRSTGSSTEDNRETIHKAFFTPLTGVNGTMPALVLFITKSYYFYTSGYPHNSSGNGNGAVDIYNILNRSHFKTTNTGYQQWYHEVDRNAAGYRLNLLTETDYSSSYGPTGHGVISLSFSLDSMLVNSTLRLAQTYGYGDNFHGMVVGDFDSTFVGKEMVWGAHDSLFISRFPTNLNLRVITGVNYLSNIYFIYNAVNNSLDKHFIVGTGYVNGNRHTFFVDTDNGALRYVIRPPSYTPTGSINLQNTDTDNLYVKGTSTIIFFQLAPRAHMSEGLTIPNTFFLSSNYPNPFNASTMIEYGLPESGPVKVEIFDILGRKIQTLVDETQAAGYHQVVWNGEDAPSGTYFYRIQAGEKSQTKKCLLLK
jgi:hypothetical protein